MNKFFLYRKKIEVPRTRFQVEFHVTKERKEFLENIKDNFKMSRHDVYIQGILSLLDVQADIKARIFCSDYIELYRTKTRNITAKRRTGAEYTTMYVYRIDALNEQRVRIFYKENNEIDDYNFKIYHSTRKRLNKNVFDEFPAMIGETIPE
jgi:hypothetical protein